MSNKLSIGTVAKLKDISVKTLRYYDKIGLLKPHYTDDMTGYRYYDSSQLLYIEFIKFFQHTGASLEEINTAFKDDDALIIADFAAAQIDKARHQIEEMEESISNYKSLCKKVYNDHANANNKDVYWQRISERQIITRDTPSLHWKHDSFYDCFWEMYQEIRHRNFSTLYATGYILDLTSLTSESEIRYSQVYVETRPKTYAPKEPMETIPQGEYLCVNFREDNYQTQINKLKAAIKEQKTQPKYAVQLDTYNNIVNWNDPIFETQVLF